TGALVAQDPEELLQLTDRLAAGALDATEGLLRDVRVASEGPPGGAGLDPDEAHRVRDHVVELAGDPEALVEHRAPRVLSSLDLQLAVALGEQLLALATVVGCVAQDPGG